MIAHGLAQAGAKVVIASRTEEELDAAAKRLNAGLLSAERPAAIIADINTLFRGSF